MFRKSRKINDKGQAQLKTTIFFVTSFFLILGSVVLKHLLLVYSLLLITILYFAYHNVTNGKNGNDKPTRMESVSRAYRRRKLRSRAKVKVRTLKQKVIGPKPVRIFLPLFIFFVILYVFLSHTLFFAVVTSDSMSPAFKTGDIVLMKGVDIEVEEEDIIMFTVPDVPDLVIHRVDEVTDDGILTRGDATNQTDDWVVSQANVSGEVVHLGGSPVVIPSLGWYFITNPPGNGAAPFSSEMHFTSLMLLTIKNIGVVIFIVCLLLYIVLTMRDYRRYEKIRRA